MKLLWSEDHKLWILKNLLKKLNTKVKKCTDLSFENNELRANVQTLKVELEEVQDNFREDEADKYRSVKRELENNAKNCCVFTI